MADLNPVKGSEQGGLRPVLVVQNNRGNKYSPTVIVISITGNIHKQNNLPVHVPIMCKGLSYESIALAEQLRTVDKCRLITFLGCLNKNSMRMIDKALKVSIGVN